MKRQLMESLKLWKESPYRKPLILRGVRQCGKTWLLNEFGKLYFDDVAYFTFDKNESLSLRFEKDLDVRRIISELEIIRKRRIDPKKTLIIFDEIQFSGHALSSLKYFCEDAPEYHIACAGSYLGIALAEPAAFPVGKVDFLTLRPLSFFEFLDNQDEQMLTAHIGALRAGDVVPELFSSKLEDYLRTYFITGGMPEALSVWLDTNDIELLERIQQQILDSYELDFAKHAPAVDFAKMTAIWRSVPEQLARESGKFFFSHAKKGARAKDLEDALEWMINAGVVIKVAKVEKPYMPISTYADQNYFKLYFPDVGLLRKKASLPPAAVLDGSETGRHFRGALAENFVLNELMNVYEPPLFYWTSGNKAEVDFVIQDECDIVPIEVKSGKNVKSKSLSVFMEKYATKRGLICSLLNTVGNNIPLYLIWNLKEILHGK